MAQMERTSFPHRRNSDGSFDSICTQCFRTIATANAEAELQAAERAHDCKGFYLGEVIVYGAQSGDRTLSVAPAPH
jgi:hypothetical protein